MNTPILQAFDQLISVTAIRFAQGFRVIPQRIELDGISYDCQTGRFAKDDRTFIFRSEGKIFELTPGQNNYDWKLKSVSAA